MKIAIAGKGGTGKTFIAANLARMYARHSDFLGIANNAHQLNKDAYRGNAKQTGRERSARAKQTGQSQIGKSKQAGQSQIENQKPVGQVHAGQSKPVGQAHAEHTKPVEQVYSGHTKQVGQVYVGHTKQVGQVYVLDADPAGGVGAALGLSQSEIDKVKPIVDMREFIEPGKEDGALYLSAPDVDSVGGQYSTLADGGINFLRMAYIKQAGTECYCPEHGFLQALIKSMLLNENDILILDMSAGIEHLTRGAIKGVDILLIVSEATRACIETSKLIKTLGADLGIAHIHYIANKIRSEKEEVLVRASFRRGELIGLVRMSDAVLDHAIGVGVGREPPPFKPTADLEELFRSLQSIYTYER